MAPFPTYLIVAVILMTQLTKYIVQSQACTANTIKGEANPSTKITSTDSNADATYLACNGDYAFDCCGIVDQWKYYVKAAGSIDLQIWSPGGGPKNLVGATTHTPGGINVEETVTPTVNYLVKAGYCIGWNAGGVDTVPYNTEASGVDFTYVTAATGTTVDFTTGTTVTGRKYAIQARVQPSTAPVFSTTPGTSYTIADSTAVSTSVASVTFTDTDGSDTLSITMAANTYFEVTDNGDKTGTVKTHATTSVSGATGTTETLTFTATDQCGNTDTGTYTITVTSAPVLTGLPTSVQVPEVMSVETLIYTISCTKSGSTVVNTIQAITPNNDPNSPFFSIQTIPSTTNSGVYARAQLDPAQGKFDYGVQHDYIVTIKCTADTISVTGNLTVNVQQNQAPVITNIPAGTSINVSTTVVQGATVFTVTYSDNENDTVNLTHSCSPTNCPFNLLDSGVIQATQDLSTITGVGFDITVNIADSSNSGISRILTIVMTDINSTPSFVNLNNNIVVNENTAVGTSVFNVTFTDPDASDTHTFAWVATPALGSSIFAIDNATGLVTVASALNYESLATTTHTYTITLSDGRAEITGTLSIAVGDVNEAPVWTATTYRTSVDDGAAVGTTLPDPGLAVTDPDVNDSKTCLMDCGTNNGYFSLSTACVVRVTATYSLDAGLTNSVICNVTAVDKGSNTATTTLTIDIADANNYAPTFNFSTYGFTVSQYAAVDTTVGTVAASDRDTGTFGSFSFSLNQSGLSASYFKISGSTGVISTQADMSTCSCGGTTITVPVLATDTGGRVGTATVYISVLVVTTTTVSVTTARYRTFLEDSKNAVWFALLITTAVLVLAATVFICVKYVAMSRNICPPRYKFQPRPQRPRPFPRHNHESIRNPPPRKEWQAWRTDVQF